MNRPSHHRSQRLAAGIIAALIMAPPSSLTAHGSDSAHGRGASSIERLDELSPWESEGPIGLPPPAQVDSPDCPQPPDAVYGQPTIPVHTNRPMNDPDTIYIPLYQSSDRPRWDGNLKKYALCTDDATCRVGELLDTHGNPATDPETGVILDTARSLWSDSTDGADMYAGGAASRIPPHHLRRVYSDDGAPRIAPRTTLATPSVALDPEFARTSDNPQGWPEAATLGISEEHADDVLTDLIHWMRGRHRDNHEHNRHAFADAQHGQATLITYGVDNRHRPIDRLLIGTNDGALRMIDADTGNEEWVFYAPGQLDRQHALYRNEPGPRLYGLDGTPTVLIIDRNGDGVIDPATAGDHDGDRAIAYIASGRGGRDIYAMDVTPDRVLDQSGQTGHITPGLLWWISGDNHDDAPPPLRDLGQTTSTPRPARISIANGGDDTRLTSVLIFGGGHDPAFDQGADPLVETAESQTALGASLYIIDALSGEPVLRIGPPTQDDSTAPDVVAPAMRYPIASDVTLLDTSGNGAMDRLYVGDLGGQLWRVDLDPKLAPGAPGRTAAARLAVLADPQQPAERRRIAQPPAVRRHTVNTNDDGAPYDLITVATGDPTDPLSTSVNDRVYALRDYLPHASLQPDNPEHHYPLCAKPGGTTQPCGSPHTESTLLDISDEQTRAPTADEPAHFLPVGWVLRLDDPGEKSLAPPLISGDTLFVTTYVPPADHQHSHCGNHQGHARLHEIDLRDDDNEDDTPPDPDEPDDSDHHWTPTPRSRDLDVGLPGSPVQIFGPDGVRIVIPGSNGLHITETDIPREIRRTFWSEDTEWTD